MFSIGESRELNTFALNFGLEGFKQGREINLNYLRTLRLVLERECRALVNREWEQAPEEGQAEDLTLVKSRQLPEPATLKFFLDRILGIYGMDLPYDSGATEYRSAMEQAISVEGSSLKDIYIVACVAIASDPVVFVY